MANFIPKFVHIWFVLICLINRQLKETLKKCYSKQLLPFCSKCFHSVANATLIIANTFPSSICFMCVANATKQMLLLQVLANASFYSYHPLCLRLKCDHVLSCIWPLKLDLDFIWLALVPSILNLNYIDSGIPASILGLIFLNNIFEAKYIIEIRLKRPNF